MHARDCFAELGYSGASMNAIAQRAGIRKASLFHHFAGKEKLYIEVLSSVISELTVFVQDAGLGEGAFATRLDRLGELSERWLSQNPSAARLRFGKCWAREHLPKVMPVRRCRLPFEKWPDSYNRAWTKSYSTTRAHASRDVDHLHSFDALCVV